MHCCDDLLSTFRGYADPEYVATGVISEKTDVYSFGIVLLEIISGKLCVSGYNVKNRSRRTIFPEFVSIP